jgi:hypothetical protein
VEPAKEPDVQRSIEPTKSVVPQQQLDVERIEEWLQLHKKLLIMNQMS